METGYQFIYNVCNVFSFHRTVLYDYSVFLNLNHVSCKTFINFSFSTYKRKELEKELSTAPIYKESKQANSVVPDDENRGAER
jgi:hypothetical protein